MKKLLLIGAVGIVGYMAYKQYKKKKGGCDCGCNSCQDTPAPAAPTSEIIPDTMREVFDARPTSFFRPPARKPMVGSFATKDSNELAYGAGTTETMDINSAVAFVQQ